MDSKARGKLRQDTMFQNLFEEQDKVSFVLTIVMWLAADALLVYVAFRGHELLWMVLALSDRMIWTARAIDKVVVIGGGVAGFAGIYLIDRYFNRATTNRTLMGRFCCMLGILSLSLFGIEAMQGLLTKIVFLFRLGAELLGGISLYLGGRALIRGDDVENTKIDRSS